MTDNEPQSADEQDAKKPLGLNRPGRLELKKTVESGQVRQSFSHGRTKTVQVEKKKKRTFQRGQAGNMTEVPPTTEGFAPPNIEPIPAAHLEEEKAVQQLTVEEKAARARAVEGALKAEIEVKEGANQDPNQDEAPIAEPSVLIDEGPLADEAEQRVEDERDPKAGAASLEAIESMPSAPSPSSKKSEAAGAKEPAREGRPAGRGKEGDSDTEDEGRGGKGKRKGDGRRLSIGRQGVRGNRRARKMTVSQALNEEERQRS